MTLDYTWQSLRTYHRLRALPDMHPADFKRGGAGSITPMWGWPHELLLTLGLPDIALLVKPVARLHFTKHEQQFRVASSWPLRRIHALGEINPDVQNRLGLALPRGLTRLHPSH